MRINIHFSLLLMVTAMLISCSADETLMEAQNYSGNLTLVENRSASNVLLYGDEILYGVWNTGLTSDLDGLLDNTDSIFAYNGTGGQFFIMDNVPAIEYIQGQKDVQEDCFHYYYGVDGQGVTEGDAFSYVRFSVRNEISNLHLVIRGLELKNIVRKGVFLFPHGINEAGWLINKNNGSIQIKLDSVAVVNTVTVGGEDGFPVIPQSVDEWNIHNHPVLDGGCYVMLDCIIYQISDTKAGYQSEKDIPIWCSEDRSFRKLAIPVEGVFKMGELTDVKLVLKEGAPWMNVSSITPVPVLNPISFDATVSDWGNVEN